MSVVTIDLPENMTIAKVHALHDEYEELLNGENIEEICLNADKVEKVDTAGMQLILSVVRAGAERQTKVEWKSPSNSFMDTANILGLTQALAL